MSAWMFNVLSDLPIWARLLIYKEAKEMCKRKYKSSLLSNYYFLCQQYWVNGVEWIGRYK